MRKIPTVFVRNETDRRYVTPEVTAGCEWVLNGEGRATRKFDGTCVMFDGARWWARREVKPGKQTPPEFVEIGYDATTGKTVGWEPAEQSGFSKWLDEVLDGPLDHSTPGTYELCGPKINGDPEGLDAHMLIPHGQYVLDLPRDFDGIKAWLADTSFEGVVWHHPDGRMAKIKRRDFPRAGQSGDGGEDG